PLSSPVPCAFPDEQPQSTAGRSKECQQGNTWYLGRTGWGRIKEVKKQQTRAYNAVVSPALQRNRDRNRQNSAFPHQWSSLAQVACVPFVFIGAFLPEHLKAPNQAWPT
ncbi:UNVERIFIED_CONTAM: hypothetical protein K2H54_011732, partial [Gekko kuhli]